MRMWHVGRRCDGAAQDLERAHQVATSQVAQALDLQAFGIVWIRGQDPAHLGQGFIGSTKLQQQAGPPALRSDDVGVVHARSLALFRRKDCDAPE